MLVTEEGAGAGAGAGAGQPANKKLRLEVKDSKHSNATANVDVIKAWGFNIFGFGAGYTQEEYTVAMSILKSDDPRKRFVLCAHCGTMCKSHRATVESHQASRHCREAKATTANAHKAAMEASPVRPSPPHFFAWAEKYRMRMLFKEVEKEKGDRRASLAPALAAVALSHDISFHAQQELFTGGASFSVGMSMLGPSGLGSDKTVREHAIKGIVDVQADVKKALRYAVENNLPIAVASDESPADGKACMLVHAFAPHLNDTLCVDLTMLMKAANGDMLRNSVKAIMTGEGWLTEEEYEKHVVIFAGDHPVGTCGLERDFSGMTMVTRSTRRRRMKFASFRISVLAHCYKGNLKARLTTLVRGV